MYAFVYLPVSVCYMYAGGRGGQKRMSEPLGMNRTQTVVAARRGC